MDTHDNRINRIRINTLLRTALRSFFFQGSFSSKHRQSIGFAYCMEPILREVWRDPERFHQSLIRHSENFNGNPFMATLVFGAVANMEQRLSADHDITEENIRRFKMIIGPATGSAGDRLFWSTLRPFALLSGIASAVAFGFWGAIVFIILYNMPVCFLKLHWLFAGYRLGPEVVSEIRNDLIDRAVKTLNIGGSILTGFTSIAIIQMVGIHGIELSFSLAGASVVFVFAVIMLRNNVPLHLMFLVSSVIAMFMGVFTYALKLQMFPR